MSIRKAHLQDEPAIVGLLNQLSYPDTHDFLRDKMLNIFINPNAEIWVYEQDKRVIAFISLDILTLVGLEGDLARINYFAVELGHRHKGIGKELLSFAESYAAMRKCKRIELHSSEYRKDAHRFYEGKGYKESPKYFIKSLEAEESKY